MVGAAKHRAAAFGMKYGEHMKTPTIYIHINKLISIVSIIRRLVVRQIMYTLSCVVRILPHLTARRHTQHKHSESFVRC